MKQEFTIGVFGIIKNSESGILLCLRSDYDLWNLPGGALEKGEAPWEGVVREVKEETGLDVEVEKLVGVYSKPDKSDLVFSFECNIVGGSLTLNQEARELKYFSPREIPKNTVQKQVERIRDFFEQKENVIFKSQRGPSSLESAVKFPVNGC